MYKLLLYKLLYTNYIQTFKFDFLENKGFNEQILFFLFDSFFSRRVTCYLIVSLTYRTPCTLVKSTK